MQGSFDRNHKQENATCKLEHKSTVSSSGLISPVSVTDMTIPFFFAAVVCCGVCHDLFVWRLMSWRGTKEQGGQ